MKTICQDLTVLVLALILCCVPALGEESKADTNDQDFLKKVVTLIRQEHFGPLPLMLVSKKQPWRSRLPELPENFFSSNGKSSPDSIIPHIDAILATDSLEEWPLEVVHALNDEISPFADCALSISQPFRDVDSGRVYSLLMVYSLKHPATDNLVNLAQDPIGETFSNKLAGILSFDSSDVESAQLEVFFSASFVNSGFSR